MAKLVEAHAPTSAMYDHAMLLQHLGAVLFFGGPLLYIGLWMVVDAAAIAGVVKRLVPAFGDTDLAISLRLRAGIRCAGVLLLLLAMGM